MLLKPFGLSPTEICLVNFFVSVKYIFLHIFTVIIVKTHYYTLRKCDCSILLPVKLPH